MSARIDGPGVFLGDRDCALIDRALREGLAVLAVRDGTVPASAGRVAAAISAGRVAAAISAAATEFRLRNRPDTRSAPGCATELPLGPLNQPPCEPIAASLAYAG